MRSISIQSDIETILTQYARCIPEVFAEFEINEVEVVYSGIDGVFDLVRVIDADNEVVLGEVILDEDLVAFFDIFEDDTLLLADEAS